MKYIFLRIRARLGLTRFWFNGIISFIITLFISYLLTFNTITLLSSRFARIITNGEYSQITAFFAGYLAFFGIIITIINLQFSIVNGGRNLTSRQEKLILKHRMFVSIQFLVYSICFLGLALIPTQDSLPAKENYFFACFGYSVAVIAMVITNMHDIYDKLIHPLKELKKAESKRLNKIIEYKKARKQRTKNF